MTISIPSGEQIETIWQTYSLPEKKRVHCRIVAGVALFFARRLIEKHVSIHIHLPLLVAGALLHDIDKMAPKLPNEHHPDSGVRILKEHGYPEIADLIKTHPVHAILDQYIAPKTIEEKLLYLSDKMVKDAIIMVDERFRLWREEKLPMDTMRMLDAAYPLVKALEARMFSMLGLLPEQVAQFAKPLETSTINLLKEGGEYEKD